MTGQAVRRRTLLAALLLAPALAACAPLRAARPDGPDPLIALADSARADAALADAVIAASPDLAARVTPLRDARAQHAAALEAEVARQAAASGLPTTPPVPASAAVSTGGATFDRLRSAVAAAGVAAGKVTATADVRRVGLVASVAACCTTYAEVLA